MADQSLKILGIEPEFFPWKGRFSQIRLSPESLAASLFLFHAPPKDELLHMTEERDFVCGEENDFPARHQKENVKERV